MFPSGNPACSHSSPGTPQETLNKIMGNPNQIPDNPAKNSPNVALGLCDVDVGVKWVFGHTLWDSNGGVHVFCFPNDFPQEPHNIPTWLPIKHYQNTAITQSKHHQNPKNGSVPPNMAMTKTN